MKSLWKVTKTALIILFCIEILLHLYNPFTLHEENRSNLSDYQEYELKALLASGLDSNLKHTKNSLGFRGREPEIQSKSPKIICMGGSATECFYLNDGKDWPNLLGKKIQEIKPTMWLNNAGFADKSVFDNLTLLKRRVIKLNPNYIFLMSGLDDIGHMPKKHFIEKNRIKDFYNFFELPKTIISLFKIKNKDGKNKFELLNLNQAEMLEMSDTQVLLRIAQEQPLINAYRKKLQEFADVCKSNHIQLILVSQVILFGDEKDLLSDVNLANIKIGNINGRTEALLLKQYNKCTYDLALANQLTFINLSARLPKDSRFFYDGLHFTNDGAEMVATIIFDESKDLIKK